MGRPPKDHTKALKYSKSFFNHFKMSINRLKAWSNYPVQRDKIQRFLSYSVIMLHQIKNDDIVSSGLRNFSSLSGQTYTRILISLYIEGKEAKTRTRLNLGLNQRTHKKYLDELFLYNYITEVKVKRSHLIDNKPIQFFQQEIELTAKGYDLVHFIFQILIPDELLEL